MTESVEALAARMADPSERTAEALGQALARHSVALRDSEPLRAAWVYELGALYLEQAAQLRAAFADEETGAIVE